MLPQSNVAEKQHRPAHWWKPGVSANPKGRPKGTRNKLSQQFLDDLWAHWQGHGPSAIAELCDTNPYGYVKVVADLLPKDIKLTVHAGERLERILEALEAATAPMIEATAVELGTGADPEPKQPAAVRNGPDAGPGDRAVAANGAGSDRDA